MEQLLNHIGNYISLKAEEKEWVANSFELKQYRRKSVLHQEGHRCKYLYFILKGSLYLYMTTQKGNIQAIQFGIENWWLSDFESFENQRPSLYGIQAIESVQVLRISKVEFEALLSAVPLMEKYFRMMMQKAYTSSLYRVYLIYNLSKEDRYRHFVNHFPTITQRIPQYILASFLGVTPEYISEIRGKRIS